MSPRRTGQGSRRQKRSAPAPLEEPGLFALDAGTAPPPSANASDAARSTQHAAAPSAAAVMATDAFPGESPASAISISTLTRTAKDVLEGAFIPLWVRGEVTDFKAHRNGHWYFCLRDAQAQIRCVVWSREQRRIPAPPDDGMQVVALGQLSVYAARGDMQLSVHAMTADGDGLWRKALEATIARLSTDGLLASERKRALPRHPARIVVITSRDGAALHDIAAVVRRRCPMVEIVLIPARVQGDGAPEELCAALERAARWGGADTLIIGRGGGAREDLWAFNDERVARALAASPIPTIAAIGHEVDVTVCDLVADHRAPTPSAAAEAAVPSRDALRVELRHAREMLEQGMLARLTDARRRLIHARDDVSVAARAHTDRRRARLLQLAGSLDALSPLAVLSRGYAVAQDEHGTTLSRVADLHPGRRFRLIVRDGTVAARVDSAPTMSAGADTARAGRAEGDGGPPSAMARPTSRESGAPQSSTESSGPVSSREIEAVEESRRFPRSGGLPHPEDAAT